MEKNINLLKTEKYRLMLIFLGSLALYVSFYYVFQMSSYLTLNGVWKALNYSDYRDALRNIEPGNVMYYKVIDLFRKILNAQTVYEYYDLLVYINAFFASLLNVSLYLFAQFLFKDSLKSSLWMLVHALNPGVFLLATSSEDIFPAYTCYVWMLFSFYLYSKEYKISYLVVSALFLAGVFLLHWTAGVPAILSLTIVLTWQHRYKVKALIKANALIVSILAGVFFAVSLFLSYPYIKIWYPAKSMDSMWISDVSFYKIFLLFVNSINYFFQSKSNPFLTLDIWSIIRSAIILFIFSLLLKKHYNSCKSVENKKLKVNYLILLVISVFIVGSAMNLIEQASDPQFLIQTQFVVILCILFLHTHFLIKLNILFFILSLSITLKQKQADNLFHEPIVKVVEEMGTNKYVILADGFNSYTPWSKMILKKNVNIAYYDFSFESKAESRMLDEEYIAMNRDSIQSYISHGYKLVVVGFLNQSAEQMGTKFIGYDLTEKMRGTQNYLKSNFDIDTLDSSKINPIFILKPKTNE